MADGANLYRKPQRKRFLFPSVTDHASALPINLDCRPQHKWAMLSHSKTRHFCRLTLFCPVAIDRCANHSTAAPLHRLNNSHWGKTSNSRRFEHVRQLGSSFWTYPIKLPPRDHRQPQSESGTKSHCAAGLTSARNLGQILIRAGTLTLIFTITSFEWKAAVLSDRKWFLFW